MTRFSTSGCTVVVAVVPGRPQVTVHVAGDLDVDAEQALSDVVSRVAALSPERVFVDLAEVGFAGAVLPNFLARLVGVLPQLTAVRVCRPRAIHRRVLDVTGMAQIVMISSRPALFTSPSEDAGHGTC